LTPSWHPVDPGALAGLLAARIAAMDGGAHAGERRVSAGRAHRGRARRDPAVDTAAIDPAVDSAAVDTGIDRQQEETKRKGCGHESRP